ncbi:MAG: hypothetical protein ACK4GQ_01335 [Candidatus Hadarchaeales archaeon]
MKQKIVFAKDFPQLAYAKKKLGPFESGDEVMLKCWEAQVLEKHGFLERKKISPAELRNILISEERSEKLTELPEGFYFFIGSEISAISTEEGKEAAEEIKKKVIAIIHARLPKLLALALSPEEAKNIQPEEKFLVNQLASAVDSWVKNMEKFMEKHGEEAEATWWMEFLT